MDFTHLNTLLDRLPARLRHPMLRPEYIYIMAGQYQNAEADFFLFEQQGEFFYHPFIIFSTSLNGREVKDIESAYGFGGPISSSLNSAFIKSAQQAYKAYCIKKGILVEFIRFSGCLKNDVFYDGDTYENRSVVAVDLTLEPVTSQIQRRTRSAIKKATRDEVEVIWSKEPHHVEAFIDLYYESMKRLAADAFYFFSRDTLKNLVALTQCKLALACYQGEIVAAASFFADGDFMEYHLSANNQQGQKVNATKLIIAKAMQKGAEQGMKYLHLGGGTSACENDPLLRFKMLFSKNLKKYVIGNQVFNGQTYQELKQYALQPDSGINPAYLNRVIFYRE